MLYILYKYSYFLCSREKYRELYRLESVKERRKPAKRSSTDAKNRNGKSPGRGSKPTSTATTAVPTIKINGHRSSTEDEPAAALASSEERRRDSDTADPPSTLLDGCNNNDADQSSPEYKSSFNETFAKFKKSYLSRGEAAALKRKQPASAAPISPFAAAKLKLDRRPSPFTNLLKLSAGSQQTVKLEPSSTLHQFKVEPFTIKQVQVVLSLF